MCVCVCVYHFLVYDKVSLSGSMKQVLLSPFTNESPKNKTSQGTFLKLFREKWLSWVFPVPAFSPVNKQPFSIGLKMRHDAVDCLPGTCEIPKFNYHHHQKCVSIFNRKEDIQGKFQRRHVEESLPKHQNVCLF